MYLARKLIQPQFYIDSEPGATDTDDLPLENALVTNEVDISGKILPINDENIAQ